MSQPTTIGELRASGYELQSIKQEMRKNLIAKMRAGEELFPGVVGYEETVIPQVENAILSGQDIVLLGERGQAKTNAEKRPAHGWDAGCADECYNDRAGRGGDFRARNSSQQKIDRD